MFPFQSLDFDWARLLLFSSLRNHQVGFYHPMGMNPQIFGHNPFSPNINFDSRSQNPKLSQDTSALTKKSEHTVIVIQEDIISENKQELQNHLEKNQEKKQLLLDSKKPKRPPTYLTERAFYMKQKIKGKIKSDKRVLRNRESDHNSEAGKGKLRSFRKKYELKCKQERKRVLTAKTEHVFKKQSEKLIKKVTKQYRCPFARIPDRMKGIQQLNCFCKKKMENLLMRKVTVSSQSPSQ